jgi:RNA polymerase sigma-70 factor, ECF subfamily
MSSLSKAYVEADLPAAPVAPGEANDLALLRRAQQGDRAAYGKLVLAYQDRLYNGVLRLVGDPEEARELTQEAFLRGLMKIESFRGEAGPYTWLFRIAINLAMTQLRKVRRHRIFSLDRPSGNGRHAAHDDQASSLVDRLEDRSSAAPGDGMEKRERDEQVIAALGRLDAEQRALLVMRDIEGFDYQQMADVLDVPLGTLKSKLFRARVALRQELKGIEL